MITHTVCKAGTAAGPPRPIGWFSRVMTRLGLGPSRYHILTVRGRTTGRLYSTPVAVMDVGGQKWLVAPYGVVNWVKNARVAGEVTLTRRGRSEKFKVQEVGPQEAVPVLRKYLAQISWTRRCFDAAPNSPDEAIAAELPKHPVFRLEPMVKRDAVAPTPDH